MTSENVHSYHKQNCQMIDLLSNHLHSQKTNFHWAFHCAHVALIKGTKKTTINLLLKPISCNNCTVLYLHSMGCGWIIKQVQLAQ